MLQVRRKSQSHIQKNRKTAERVCFGEDASWKQNSTQWGFIEKNLKKRPVTEAWAVLRDH